ncbi:MAG: fibronectin type III domain-containing protein [Clostridia bacterium]|nr:fibronectin type III domain-containing protein [Clostridia bacterium]
MSGLTNIMLPESVTEIGDYAFDSCSNLTNITLPENLISLGDGVFYCCKSLISLDIPENITSIGMYAFGHCYSLKNIIIPESISIIKQGAFSNCIGITDIIIPNGITNIDESLLFGCTNLKSVAIPQSVINIGEDAFANCTSLVDVYYSGSKAQWHDVKIHNNNEALENANIHFFGEENSDVTHKHSYTSSVTKTATCTETGTTTYTCTCGDTYTETIPATNHPNATTDAGKAPTTTEVGYTAGKYCPDCETWLEGHEEIPMLETHEHQFAQVDIKHSTCTETGVRYYECYCGAKREEEIPMMEHVFVYDGYEKWPTCTEEGIMRTECSCGKVSQEIIPANGHSLAYYIAVEATCTKDGLSAGSYCPDCDLVYEPQVVIPALGHDMQYQLIKATLTKGGVYNRVCKNCNSIKTIDLYPLVNGFVLSDDAYTYNGKVKTPGVTVKDETGLVLVEGKDYTLTYESGRKNPGKYTVKVTLMGNYEGEKELEFSILPGKTSKITATQSTSSIKLTWKKVTGADGYRVYQYNSKTGKYKTLKTLTGTTYTVKNLKAGTSYKFAVKAYTKADGETLWAASSKTITTCTKPATPTVKVTAGSGKATLSWSKVTGATGYVIYMEDSFGDFEKVTSTTKTSYTKKSLKKGKTYKFRVKAYKKVDGKYIYSGYKTYSVKVK